MRKLFLILMLVTGLFGNENLSLSSFVDKFSSSEKKFYESEKYKNYSKDSDNKIVSVNGIFSDTVYYVMEINYKIIASNELSTKEDQNFFLKKVKDILKERDLSNFCTEDFYIYLRKGLVLATSYNFKEDIHYIEKDSYSSSFFYV